MEKGGDGMSAAEQLPQQDIADQIRMSVLDADQAMAYWDVIVPHLMPVFEYSAGRLDLDATKKLVAAGMVEVLLVWIPETGKIFSVMVIEGKEYPGKKVFCIGLCGGEDLPIWAEKMWRAVKLIARQKGFDQIEVIGRRGWGRFIPGAHEIATFYAMDLDTEGES
jgi:hypothetical protein